MIHRQIALSIATLTAMLLAGCSADTAPFQRLSEAQAAIYAAQDKIGPCPCAALEPAEQAYQNAQESARTGQYQQAEQQADEALRLAQDVLRSAP